MNHTMSGSQSPSSSEDSASIAAAGQSIGRSRRSADGNHSLSPGLATEAPRYWRDVFWFKKKDRLNIDQFTKTSLENQPGLTEDFWPLYAVAGGVGTVLGWIWLLLLGSRANQIMKVSVHILTTYLAVISVFCFWGEQFFWGVAFAIGAALQFLYVISVIDRLPFTMLVLRGAVKMVWSLPEVMRVAYAFMLVMLLWLALWSFGAAGVVASSLGDGGRWWLLVVFSVSLFWTGAVFCNTVHVIVSGMAAIRTLRWEIRGFRSKIGNNECLLCCVDFLFHLVETLVRFFNKYAYVQIAVYGKSFNHSARDAWELFQSTGVEALIAYDCSGAVLLMSTLLGGLITGTCAGVWTRTKYPDRVIMVGSTAMLMGMIMVGLAMVVVESAVTSIYICYAEDPLLIHRWDAEFFNQMSEKLHQRLQHRSARAREVLTHSRFNGQIQSTHSV
ncbi:hypothetical protein F0562_034008 [Nyssa sinensis]|uniref:Choline transporter-like protein n=1 Tax=Nyssa sinensis TaxID=561372 RepID=A0A5J5ADY4_9ASTE|nr:hypothetical protein F0562_034008 [Nyssa sinensis]